MDEERARSVDEERDADAADSEDLAAPPAADQALDLSADEAQAEAPPESEGLADWLERVRRSAPGLLVGGPSMLAAAPPRVPESEPHEEAPPGQSPDNTTSSESSESPTDDVLSVSPISDEEESPTSIRAAETRIPAAEMTAEKLATREIETTSAVAPTEPRLMDTVEEPEKPATAEPVLRAPALAEIEQREPHRPPIEPTTRPVKAPADHAPPIPDAGPVAAGHSTAMATEDFANDVPDIAEPRRWPEPTNERRIGDLEPPEYHQPLDFESLGVQVAAPQPQAVTPLAPTVVWPQNLPSNSAGAPALFVSEPSQLRTQPSELSPRAEWVSPWPTLPDSFGADDESVDPATALRARDRWMRLLREQESA